MKVYLELEQASGLFFEYSKTEAEGFTKKFVENPITKEVKISYRKYYPNGIFGNLLSFSSRSKKMNDRDILTLSIVMDNPVDGNTYFCSLPLFTPNNRITDFATSAIRYLPNLEKDAPYRLKPYAFETKDTGRKVYGVSFNIARLSDSVFDDINKIPQLTFATSYKKEDGTFDTKPGDIPLIEWEEVFGKTTANTKNRDSYLWNVLKEKGIEYQGGGFGGASNTFNSKEESSVVESNKDNVDNNNNLKTESTSLKKEEKPVVQESDEDFPF